MKSRTAAGVYYILLLAFSLPRALKAQTVITTLDPGAFAAAVEAGGTVTFAVSGTIALTNTITVSNNVIVNGTNQSVTISGGGSNELFQVPSGISLSLLNLTLANGKTNGETMIAIDFIVPTVAFGGAINSQGNLDVEQCIFSNNVAQGGYNNPSEGPVNTTAMGGAIYSTGMLTITNSLFVNNSVTGGEGQAQGGGYTGSGGNGNGGAICNAGGSVCMSNVMFLNNAVSGGTAAGPETDSCGNAYGGALFTSGGTVTGVTVSIVGNKATAGQINSELNDGFRSTGGFGYGGGFCITGGTGLFSNSVFSNNGTHGGDGNGAASGAGSGGSIFNSGFVVLTSCSVSASSATGAGTYPDYAGPGDGLGGAIYNAGTMQVGNSTISGNSADGGVNEQSGGPVGGDAFGGGIYNSGSLSLENSDLSTNQSLGGESIYNLTGNGWGGGLANTGYVQISNTVLADNITGGPGEYPLQIIYGNLGEAIYNTGVIQSDSASSILPALTGTPPLTFQWQSNGVNIAGATNSNFSLGAIQFAVLQTNDLVISNSGGLVANFEEILNLPPPPLTITSITPNSGPPSGGTSITISGTGFTNGAKVYFGNTAATSVAVASATNITAQTPPGANGPVNVTITNGDFQPLTLINAFTYWLGPQNLTASLSPGVSVNIQYSGTSGASYVLQTTTNLSPPINWQPVATNIASTNGNCSFIDTNAFSNPALFYRAVLP